MSFVMDPVNIVNLILCILILIFGFKGYGKKKDKVLMYVALAFGIFGFSHLMTLLDLAKSMEWFLIAIRIIAYLLVVFAVFKIEK